MIRAFVFDLDGTLVETEKLKARSYAPGRLSESIQSSMDLKGGNK
jgi:phosphoglycolate phosphatase-like HAD superfamily hydrolase